MRRAILSVSDKTGLVDFARGLSARGFELISTGGTARTLTEHGVNVVGVTEVTGFPEMMDGRVKTLHPKIHGGILARRAYPDDLGAATAQGIALIDLVCVNLYPFVHIAAKRDVAFDDLVEQIDIGGPSLVRAAAKNFRDVLVVVRPDDYSAVLAALDDDGGPALAFRFDLARRAFAHTANYDTAIASTLAEVRVNAGMFTRTLSTAAMRETLTLTLRKVRDLRYGENPHQRAALYDGFGQHPGFAVLQGKELSYTNLLDLDAAARIVIEFAEPAAAVIKHTNPCGAATGSTIVDAYMRARDADSLAAFGGIVGLNRSLDAETAKSITSTFIEAVIAPSVDEDVRSILAAKANMRVVVPARPVADVEYQPSEDLELRSIIGGVLVQARDAAHEAHQPWPGGGDLRVVTRRQPTDEEWQAMRFAWRVMAHVKSNTVIFADSHQTRAIGAGQMSRVDAVKVATMKAAGWNGNVKRPLAGTVAASDAFFPFRDGLDAVAAAGATAVVQPGGSVRDDEVIAAANEHGIAMVFTGRRHFRH